MRGLAVAIFVFGLLAFDLSTNDGEWTEEATAFLRHLSYEIQTVLHG